MRSGQIGGAGLRLLGSIRGGFLGADFELSSEEELRPSARPPGVPSGNVGGWMLPGAAVGDATGGQARSGALSPERGLRASFRPPRVGGICRRPGGVLEPGGGWRPCGHRGEDVPCGQEGDK